MNLKENLIQVFKPSPLELEAKLILIGPHAWFSISPMVTLERQMEAISRLSEEGENRQLKQLQLILRTKETEKTKSMSHMQGAGDTPWYTYTTWSYTHYVNVRQPLRSVLDWHILDDHNGYYGEQVAITNVKHPLHDEVTSQITTAIFNLQEKLNQ